MCILASQQGLNPLNDNGDALATADASRAERILLVESNKVVCQVGHDPSSTCAQRMAKSDGATEQVGLVRRQLVPSAPRGTGQQRPR